METMKDIKRITPVGVKQKSPLEDFQKKAQEQIENYKQALDECRKIMINRKLRVFEQTRIANELNALTLEDFANNIEDYINKKFNELKD